MIGSSFRKPARRSGPARLLAAALAVAVGAPHLVPHVTPVLVSPAAAQQQERRNLPIVRDAEIEALLRDYANPIFKAAGINAGATRIILVNDRSFNAFVANGRKIFINVGALMDAQTPNEVIGVIAHEAGHIAGGHLARLRDQLANAQILSVIGMLAGAAAVGASATSGGRVGSSGAGGMGAILGPQELVRRNLLAYQRSEEQAADQSAIRYLAATGQSPRGMLDTFRRFADTGLFRSASLDPYLLSHPLPSERIAQLERLAKQSPHFERKDPPALQARHDLMRAKLFGFTERRETVLRRYPPHDTSVPARYARAILAHRSGQLAEALSLVDGLIRGAPGNAYFQELRGQILLESGRARDAVAPLRRAVQLAPSATPIRTLLGQSLVAANDPRLLDEAIKTLEGAAAREPDMTDAFRHLAIAYGRKGDIGRAELASAQAFMISGDLKNAQTQAFRAMGKLPRGSAAWLKAEDIVNYRPPGTR